MYRKEKTRILQESAKSPRCIKSTNQKGGLYSWKNYVRPEIDSRFQNLIKSQIRQEIPIYSRTQYNDSSSSDRQAKSTKQIGTSTRAIEGYFSEDEDLPIPKARTKNEVLTSAGSSELQDVFLYQILGKKIENNQDLDLYHLGLKEEERLYLLKKFMEHYEKIHDYKL